METIIKGTWYKVMKDEKTDSSVRSLTMITGSHTRNPNGTGQITLKKGDRMQYDRDNDFDQSFWVLNGVDGKIHSMPQSLLDRGMIKKCIIQGPLVKKQKSQEGKPAKPAKSKKLKVPMTTENATAILKKAFKLGESKSLPEPAAKQTKAELKKLEADAKRQEKADARKWNKNIKHLAKKGALEA